MANNQTQQPENTSSVEQQRIDEDAALWFTRVHSQQLSDQQSQEFKIWLRASKAHEDAYEAIAGIWQDIEKFRALRLLNRQRQNLVFHRFGSLSVI